MTAAQSHLSKDFPEKDAVLQRLCQENPAFALLTAEYETLSQRLAGESLAPAELEELTEKHAVLKHDIKRHIKLATGSCCGGCGG